MVSVYCIQHPRYTTLNMIEYTTPTHCRLYYTQTLYSLLHTLFLQYTIPKHCVEYHTHNLYTQWREHLAGRLLDTGDLAAATQHPVTSNLLTTWLSHAPCLLPPVFFLHLFDHSLILDDTALMVTKVSALALIPAVQAFNTNVTSMHVLHRHFQLVLMSSEQESFSSHSSLLDSFAEDTFFWTFSGEHRSFSRGGTSEQLCALPLCIFNMLPELNIISHLSHLNIHAG